MSKRNTPRLFSRKYAFEFVSIFIAVISAFALNNWNDHRKDREAEEKILIEIDKGLDKDLYDLPPEEEAAIPQVAFSFDEALKALDADRAFLTEGGVFDDDMIDGFIELKYQEVQRARLVVHPCEFDMYYSV